MSKGGKREGAGRPNGPVRKLWMARTTPETYDQVKAAAKECKMSIGDFVSMAVENLLSSSEQEQEQEQDNEEQTK